jgi:ferric-dicitrate binding protein FerR (iron transport regulator)
MQSYGRGAFYLTPTLLCRQRGFGKILSDTSDTGAYDVSVEAGSPAVGPGAGRPNLLVLTVETGAALIQWTSADTARPLKVYAPGGPVLVKGTELAIIVDSARKASLVYVREGVVRLERHPDVRLQPGQVFRIGETEPPADVSDETLRSEFEREFTFHSSTVWKASRLPLWKRKSFYAVAGAAVVGGVVVWRNNNGDGKPAPRRSGAITVHIPL